MTAGTAVYVMNVDVALTALATDGQRPQGAGGWGGGRGSVSKLCQPHRTFSQQHLHERVRPGLNKCQASKLTLKLAY